MVDCDFCGKEVKSRFIIWDGDLVLCSDCFIDIYRDRMERETGARIIDRQKEIKEG